jgi:hypothetical protein
MDTARHGDGMDLAQSPAFVGRSDLLRRCRHPGDSGHSMASQTVSRLLPVATYSGIARRARRRVVRRPDGRVRRRRGPHHARAGRRYGAQAGGNAATTDVLGSPGRAGTGRRARTHSSADRARGGVGGLRKRRRPSRRVESPRPRGSVGAPVGRCHPIAPRRACPDDCSRDVPESEHGPQLWKTYRKFGVRSQAELLEKLNAATQPR